MRTKDVPLTLVQSVVQAALDPESNTKLFDIARRLKETNNIKLDLYRILVLVNTKDTKGLEQEIKHQLGYDK